MNKIKDILYDKNDILIALIIIVVATLIISGRINVIMDYPEALAKEAEQNAARVEEQNQQDNQGSGQDGQSEPVGTGGGGETGTPPAAGQGEGGESQNGDGQDGQSEQGAGSGNSSDAGGTSGTAGGPVTVQIPAGSSGEAIAQILVDKGLIPSKDAFFSAVTAAGVETKLQAGTFTIPEGATPQQIVTIITK